jgi:hypothetical protein
MSKVAIYKFLGMHLCFEESYCSPVEPVTAQDQMILRELAKKIAEIASLPAQEEKKLMWKNLNSLKPVRPLIGLDEICWHEMDVDRELTLLTSTEFSQKIEATLRQTLYQWKYMRGDMVIESVLYSPLAISNSGIGLTKKMETLMTDENNDIVSQHFEAILKDENDVDKLKYPLILHDKILSNEIFYSYSEIFDGILNVKKRGAPGFWFAPWDHIVMLTGVQDALFDLIARPEYIHKLVKKMVDIGLNILDQYVSQNLLSLNNYNLRVGSGAYGYCEDLPKGGFDPDRVRLIDQWGCAVAQILGSVSPEMHEEFALQYEIKWAERFGLLYYGCCEALSNKIHILEKIPNLRKISISPWANVNEAAEQINNRYVISLKPSPSILAGNNWDPKDARNYLEEKLKAAGNNNVEIVMKDISTVGYQPRRLWEWTKIAMETAEKFTPE